ncbi:verprolin-like [Ornithorhynchus anatinus]|uniref:verprolin-like n=1 Tax=Ornithorhynchus anatinus TaxID=9258 RepID=UPI0010A7DAFD|nr:verprolin-like [Ornithorhynchus anatinus]
MDERTVLRAAAARRQTPGRPRCRSGRGTLFYGVCFFFVFLKRWSPSARSGPGAVPGAGVGTRLHRLDPIRVPHGADASPGSSRSRDVAFSSRWRSRATGVRGIRLSLWLPGVFIERSPCIRPLSEQRGGSKPIGSDAAPVPHGAHAPNPHFTDEAPRSEAIRPGSPGRQEEGPGLKPPGWFFSEKPSGRPRRTAPRKPPTVPDPPRPTASLYHQVRALGLLAPSHLSPPCSSPRPPGPPRTTSGLSRTTSAPVRFPPPAALGHAYLTKPLHRIFRARSVRPAPNGPLGRVQRNGVGREVSPARGFTVRRGRRTSRERNDLWIWT